LAVLVALLLVAFAAWLRFPPINDLTTTPEAPPRFRADPPGDVAYPESFTSLQGRAYADLAPLALPDSVPAAFGRALAAAHTMPRWHVVFQSDSLGVLQAEARTRIFGFLDDVIVEVRPEEKGSTIHVRSRSRVGRSDLGENARRIRVYLAQLE
jgi:uncharacterized protein (DUF1499 family)